MKKEHASIEKIASLLKTSSGKPRCSHLAYKLRCEDEAKKDIHCIDPKRDAPHFAI